MPDKAKKIRGPANPDTDVRVRGSSPDTEFTAAVRERLRLALREAGGNKAVSQRSGVGSSTIDYALSAGSMRLQTAQQLATATGVRLEWLASGEGPMRPDEAPTAPAEAAPPPQPASTAGPLRLFPNVHMDRLAAAYGAARALLAARGIHTPDPLDLVRIMTTIYDELTEVEARPSESLRDWSDSQNPIAPYMLSYLFSECSQSRKAPFHAGNATPPNAPRGAARHRPPGRSAAAHRRPYRRWRHRHHLRPSARNGPARRQSADRSRLMPLLRRPSAPFR